jgi:lipopolysaccharide/colanic/teichoic acid biosynthesis glycosyltransferase
MNEVSIDVTDPRGTGTANRPLRPQRGLMRDTTEPGIVTGESPRPMPAADGALALDFLRQAPTQLDDVLPKHYFLKQLEREKRRTDRSRASLSMVLFRFDRGRGDPIDDVDRLLRVLCKIKRETDIVGYLSEDLVAVLLPDTTEQGTPVLTRKVVANSGDLAFSTVAATYPDRVFDHLNGQNQAIPDPSPFFPEGLGGVNDGSYALKRSLDIVGAIAALLLLAPLMLVIAMAVAVTSSGPVIFRQVRLGKRGIPFSFYKFRSMHCNADDQIHREYVGKLIAGDLEGINRGEPTKPLYKMKDDPRVTRVGRLIRKTSMDELPQLFNVLKGDMSLVGPRPPLPYEAEKYQSWHLRRVLELKPGITGLWQVNGRSKTSFDDMVRMDLRYTRTCSLALDLKILLKTVKVVLRGDGAN